MILIVGLGNPGKKYEKTWHNLGFTALNNLQSKIESFLNWRKENKFMSEISEGKIADEKIILAKPLTYMNNSGRTVKSLTKYYNALSDISSEAHYKLKTSNLFVVHDDIDLSFGKIKIVKGREAAGHKGVESIIENLGTKDFVRFRIGIQPQKGKPKNVEKFVLQKFNKEEEKIVKEVIEKTVQAVEIVIKEGVEKAMTKYN